jgi:hypothetical protein
MMPEWWGLHESEIEELALRNQNPYAVTLGDMEPHGPKHELNLTDEDVKFLKGLNIETSGN